MVLTLELPLPAVPPAFHLVAKADPVQAYEERFGARPAWFDEIDPATARQLARLALRRGTPLAAADYLF